MTRILFNFNIKPNFNISCNSFLIPMCGLNFATNSILFQFWVQIPFNITWNNFNFNSHFRSCSNCNFNSNWFQNNYFYCFSISFEKNPNFTSIPIGLSNFNLNFNSFSTTISIVFPKYSKIVSICFQIWCNFLQIDFEKWIFNKTPKQFQYLFSIF